MAKPATRADARPDPAVAAAALYFGDVMHARLKPVGHRFSYRVMSLLIDLDRLAEADRLSPLFGVNRAAIYSCSARGRRLARPLSLSCPDRRRSRRRRRGIRRRH